MRVKSSAALNEEFLVSAGVLTHFDDGGPHGSDGPPPRDQLNAVLAVDFKRAWARRYLIRRGFAARPFPIQAEEFRVTGMLRRFDVEHVRRTGRLELSGVHA